MRVNERSAMKRARAPARKKRNQHVYRVRQLRHFACVYTLISVATMGPATSPRPLRAERESLDHAAPEVIERLRADPYDYFRFVNRSWIAGLRRLREQGLPVVRLHGDAHVEQFAITRDAWGLDDFDREWRKLGAR